MRLPSSARFAGLLAFVCVSLSLGFFAPGAPAARGADDLDQVEAKLARCKKDLAEAREAVQNADAFLDLVRKKRVFFFPGPSLGQFIPVRVDDYRDQLILEFVTGQISRDELARSLANMTRRFAQTLRTLAELRDEARADVEQTLKRCAALTEQRNRLRAGGGGGGGEDKGAFPGGTATTMTFTIAGTTVTTDLKSNRQTGDPTIKGKSSSTLDGSVSLNGTLPPGWVVAVFHNGSSDIVLNSPTGGKFSLKPISTSFDAVTRPGAYVCSTKVPPLCTPAAQSSIAIDWDP